MKLRRSQLAASLLALSLLVHELAYAFAGGGVAGAHGYLEVAVPCAAALAASLGFATLVAPALGSGRGEARPFAPLALAGAVVGTFAFQEIAESLLLGGGPAGLAASIAVAWAVPPLALLGGALLSGLIVALERTGRRLAIPPRRRLRFSRVPALHPVPATPFTRVQALGNLAFGFARRPPPARVEHA